MGNYSHLDDYYKNKTDSYDLVNERPAFGTAQEPIKEEIKAESQVEKIASDASALSLYRPDQNKIYDLVAASARSDLSAGIGLDTVDNYFQRATKAKEKIESSAGEPGTAGVLGTAYEQFGTGGLGVATGVYGFGEFVGDIFKNIGSTVGVTGRTIMGKESYPNFGGVKPGETTFGGGRFTEAEIERVKNISPKKYLKIYDSADTWYGGVWDVILQSWKDTPDKQSASEWITSTLNASTNNPTVLQSTEIEQATRFFRPEATLVEQLIRLAPEVFGAGKMALFISRGNHVKKVGEIAEAHNEIVDDKIKEAISKNASKNKIKELQDSKIDFAVPRSDKTFAKGIFSRAKGREKAAAKQLGVTGKRSISPSGRSIIDSGGVSILNKLNQKELGDAIESAASKNLLAESVTDWLRVGNFRRKAFSNRIVRAAQYDKMNETILKANRQIRRTDPSDTLEIYKLNQLKKQAIPLDFKSVLVTEAMLQASYLAAGNIYGEENAWIGALGGGLVSGTVFGIAHGTTEKVLKGASTVYNDLLRSMGKISQEDIEVLVKTGKVSMKLSKQLEGDVDQMEALQNFAKIVRSLPEEQSREIIARMISFRKDVEILVEKEGIDPELLLTTLGQAGHLSPIMALKDALSKTVLDPSKALTSKWNPSKEFTQKGNELINQLEQERVMGERVVEFGKAIDNLKDKTSGVESKDLEKFIANMEGIYINTFESLLTSNDNIKLDMDKLFSFLTNPSTSHSIKNKKAYSDVISSMMDTLEAQSTMFPNKSLTKKAQQIREIIDEFSTGDGNPISIVKMFDELNVYRGQINKLLHNFHVEDSITMPKAVEQRVINELELLHNTHESSARKLFTDLKEEGRYVDVDATDWFRSFYGTENSSLYDDIIPSDSLAYISQKVADTNLPNNYTLKKLMDLKSDDALEEWWSKLPLDKKQAVVQRMNESKLNGFTRKVDRGPDRVIEKVPIVEPSDVAVHLMGKKSAAELKRAFSKGDSTLGPFDTFRMAENMSEGLDAPISINISVEDVINWEKSFNKAARKIWRSREDVDTEKARKYTLLSKDLIDSLKSTDKNLSERLTIAKDNWNKEVYQRYYNSNLPSLGYKYLNNQTSVAGQWRSGPMTWLQELIGNKITKGTLPDAQEVIQSLTRTYGKPTTIVREGGREETIYQLDQEGLKHVQRIFEDVLTIHVDGLLKNIKRSQGRLKPFDRGRAATFDEDEDFLNGVTFKYSNLEDAQKQMKSLVLNHLDSPFLNGFRNINKEYFSFTPEAGTIGIFNPTSIIKRWEDGLNDTQDFIDSMKLQRGRLNDKIEKGEARAAGVRNTHEKLIKEIFNRSGIGDTGKVANYESFKTVFIDNADGAKKLGDAVSLLIKQNPSKEKEIGSLIKNITIDSVAKEFRKSDLIEAGENFTRIIDDKGLTEYLTSNKDKLIKLFGEGGEEIYERWARMSRVLNRLNDTADSYLKENQIVIKVPTGLGLNSWISRVYSVSRGVVSPKYVATEALILAMKKKQVSAMAELLKDPKATNALLDILENPDASPKSIMDFIGEYNANLQAIFISALASEAVERKKKNRQKQMDELRSR